MVCLLAHPKKDWKLWCKSSHKDLQWLEWWTPGHATLLKHQIWPKQTHDNSQSWSCWEVMHCGLCPLYFHHTTKTPNLYNLQFQETLLRRIRRALMSWWGQACSLAVLCRKKVYRSVFNIKKIDNKTFVKISTKF